MRFVGECRFAEVGGFRKFPTGARLPGGLCPRVVERSSASWVVAVCVVDMAELQEGLTLITALCCVQQVSRYKWDIPSWNPRKGVSSIRGWSRSRHSEFLEISGAGSGGLILDGVLWVTRRTW